MANFTFRQLRYFEALARHRHFGLAAEACAISQPALSVQIKDLEEKLQLPLVERAARQVRLTPFGEAFLTRAQDILRQAEALDDFARASRGPFSGRFRLGIIPTIAPYFLPELIRHLARSHPALELDVRETLTSRLVQELSEGRLDAAILALPLSEPSLFEYPILSESFVLVRPRAEAQAPVPSRAELCDQRLLLLEEGHCFRDQSLEFCKGPSASSRQGLDGSSLSTLVQMVGAGIGVTMIPEMAVAVETRSANVSIAALQGEAPGRTIAMVWRKTNPLSGALQDIAAVAGQAAQTCRSPQ